MLSKKVLYLLSLMAVILVLVASLGSAAAESVLVNEERLDAETSSGIAHPLATNPSDVTPGVLTFHEADSTIAYNWFSYVPNSIKKDERNYILITGLRAEISDDYGVTTEVARDEATRAIPIAEKHKYITLIPAIPRPATNHVYAVAFDWKVFLPTTDPFVQRPDLKVNLMIEQLLDDLQSAGYNMDDKVFRNGK